MAQFYKILTADPLGEPYTNPNVAGAKPVQSYWCTVEGLDKPVMVGKQVGNQLYPGMHVHGDLMYAKSQKGNEYWKFKSAQVPPGVQRPQDAPAPAYSQPQPVAQPQQEVGGGVPAWFVPYGNMIQYIYDQMKGMDAEATDNTTAAMDREPEPPMPNDGSDMPADFLLPDKKGVEVVSRNPDEVTMNNLNTVFGE